MLPLCSAPLIALLVAGEDWRSFLVGTLFIGWDIIILSCYLNASIYLVKGGRLGLLPSVLFHSCRPSFRHTGVMFLDFASLTQLGFMGTPWQFALNKTPPARPNLGFTICHLASFSLGFPEPKGHLYFNPPGQCFSKCWSELGMSGAPWATRVYANPTSCPSVVPWEWDMCSSYRDLSAHRAALLVLFNHCQNVL